MNQIKYCVIVPDGIADEPLEELGGRTPLEAASTPHMDYLAANGRVGWARTIPKGLSPGSDVANLSIFGYDPATCYTGRAPLEAAAMGIPMSGSELAFRMNLVTVDGDRMGDYSAGHIGTAEARLLVELLQEKLGSDEFSFYPGVSYRHIMLYKGKDPMLVDCTPPHDITGKELKPHLPRGEGAQKLIDLMARSREVLKEAEVNQIRKDLGENPANMVWFWGQGYMPSLPAFWYRYKKKGAVITAVDLIRGLARCLELDIVDVPGATGYYDTDYGAKAAYALRALETHDLVLVHVEAPDEAGHAGDVKMKIGAIERVDADIVGAVRSALAGTPHRILVISDHPTPIRLRTHTADPVPFLIYGDGVRPVRSQSFSEKSAMLGELKFERGHELMEYFLYSGRS